VCWREKQHCYKQLSSKERLVSKILLVIISCAIQLVLLSRVIRVRLGAEIAG